MVCWVCQSMHRKVLKKCFIFLHCIFILIIFVMMHLGQKQRISQGEILLPWLKGPYPNDTLYGSYFWCICLSIYSTLIMDAPIIIALTLLHDGFSMVDDDGTTQICLSPITITDNNHLFGPAFSFRFVPHLLLFCILQGVQTNFGNISKLRLVRLTNFEALESKFNNLKNKN